MTSSAMTPRHVEQRHHRYLDPRVQLQAMVVLAALESALVAIALWLLHARLAAAIERGLYSIHFDAGDAAFPMLLDAALPVLGGFVAINFVAVVVAVQVWVQLVAHVVAAFELRLARIAALDLRPPELPREPRHPVLAHAARWQGRERERLTDFRRGAATLRADADRDALRAHLNRLRSLLHGEPRRGTVTD